MMMYSNLYLLVVFTAFILKIFQLNLHSIDEVL